MRVLSQRLAFTTCWTVRGARLNHWQLTTNTCSQKAFPTLHRTTMSSTDAATNEQAVISALQSVREQIASVSKSANRSDVQLVAVSKTKPMELVKAAYEVGQRHFGENYVQELVQKAECLPNDIKWHYIGPLQSNKAKVLASVPNLHVVETVDREKIATSLSKAVASAGRTDKLNVMVQVNTSGEETKSGCEPEETVGLAQFVNACDNLNLIGLMTIGAPDDADEPEAFKILANERAEVANALKCDAKSLKLSMGMSNDFEAAIRMGSDSVRVGSTIFGARQYN